MIATTANIYKRIAQGVSQKEGSTVISMLRILSAHLPSLLVEHIWNS